MHIGPMDVLEIGTPVSVNGKIGKVIKVEEKRNQFGGPIMLHTIQYEKKYSHSYGNQSVYKPYDKIESPNYAFVYVLERA